MTESSRSGAARGGAAPSRPTATATAPSCYPGRVQPRPRSAAGWPRWSPSCRREPAPGPAPATTATAAPGGRQLSAATSRRAGRAGQRPLGRNQRTRWGVLHAGRPHHPAVQPAAGACPTTSSTTCWCTNSRTCSSPGTAPRFWALVARYPRAERARGFLEGVAPRARCRPTARRRRARPASPIRRSAEPRLAARALRCRP